MKKGKEKHSTKVVKRNGRTIVNFDSSKIKNAIMNAMKYGSGIVDERLADTVTYNVALECNNYEKISIYDIEKLVIKWLKKFNCDYTAKKYASYVNIATLKRESARTDDPILGLINRTNTEVAESNSNKNHVILSTQRDLIAGEVSKDLMERHFLPNKILQAHNDGVLHYHDLDYAMSEGITNCCLINIKDMLDNGTIINGKKVDSPKSFQVACTVMTQIIANVASNQYGGTSINIKHLGKYLRRSKEKYFNHYHTDLNYPVEESLKLATDRMMDELKSGVQTIQYQINTLMTTNGQSPFVTLFLHLEEGYEYEEEVALIIEEILRQRILGVKDETGTYITPAFPKLIYVLDEHNCLKGGKYDYLTKIAVECSSKRMYPDYISAKKMREHYDGNVFSCMGCVDGQEIITYKINNKIYVESFERMWKRLEKKFKIELIDDNKNSLNMFLEGVEIYDTKKGFTKVKRLIRNLSNSWVEVKLSNGRFLKCTSDHPFEVEGKGIVQANKLNINDEILINLKSYDEGEEDYNIHKAWLLGFILCDGCYDRQLSSTIAFKGEEDIKDYYIKCMKECFNEDVEVIDWHRGVKGDYKELRVKNYKKISNEFLHLFEGLQKKNRHIPNEVFRWKKEYRLAFLAGMIDADGYINDKTSISKIQIGSTNKELSLQQMYLIQSLNIPSKIYLNHYDGKDYSKIRYRVEGEMTQEIINYLKSQKKIEHFNNCIGKKQNNRVISNTGKVKELKNIIENNYSYDVETESEHFEVSGVYSHNCRSFLSPWLDSDGNVKFEGRLNGGVVSLNLPQIAILAKGDKDLFYHILENRLELCKEALLFRYHTFDNTISDISPIHWQNGAIARLKKGEKIADTIKDGYMTMSLGYIGIYETTLLMTGESQTTEKGNKFALDLMHKLKDAVDSWKAETRIGFGLYGTPKLLWAV